jgi:ubiquinone/menaquinone biosynthesis C-methylase UbiE
MMDRVLEPEVMDTPEEARDYDAMDHATVNVKFCDDLLAFANRDGRPPLGRRAARVVDFGTGTALIPIELCARAADVTVVAIDLAENMLALAHANVARTKLGDRVLLEKVDAKDTPYEEGAFGATISNSLVHHIPKPERCLAEMWRVTARGGLLFVRDLYRPPSDVEVDRLVVLHAGKAPADPKLVPPYESQRALLRASLCASMTVTEVIAMVAPLGIPASAVAMTSDRHWTLACEKP